MIVRIPKPEERIQSFEQLAEVVARISFAPNCIDMGWAWNLHQVEADPSKGWLIATTFQRPDRETGKISRGMGRDWYIAYNATTSSVVKTCFAACKMILEHEVMEAFLYKGARIFDPHNTVEELTSLQGAKNEPKP